MHHTPRCNITNFKVEENSWLVIYFTFVWFLPFWLGCPCLWFIVLLKLGGYGLLRVFSGLFKSGLGFGIFQLLRLFQRASSVLAGDE